MKYQNFVRKHRTKINRNSETKMAHISVVIPVYKAEECIDELYRRLLKVVEKIDPDFEILFIEDSGGDRSWDKIIALSQKDPRVKGLQFSRNFGQHYGITAGLDHCNANWVIVMDCDLQDRPEEIPKLYHKAQEGCDIVLAVRGKRQDSLLKRLLSRLFYRIFSYFLGFEYNGEVGNFRIMSRKAVEAFRLLREKARFFGALVAWTGFQVTEVEVEHAERFAGKSAYDFKKLWQLAWDSIIAYSDKPLKLTIRLGFMISVISFCYGIYILIHAFLYHTTVPGWNSLIVSIYFMGGIIISIMGILGIYLGKIFDETKKRPLYLIKEKTNDIL